MIFEIVFFAMISAQIGHNANFQKNDDCDYAPIELQVTDFIWTGDFRDRVEKKFCLRSTIDRGPFAARRDITVGRLKLGNFKFAKEKIGYGFDWKMVVHRGNELYFNPNYSLQLFPTLYLPPKWERNLEIASDSALIVGTGIFGALWILEMAGAL